MHVHLVAQWMNIKSVYRLKIAKGPIEQSYPGVDDDGHLEVFVEVAQGLVHVVQREHIIDCSTKHLSGTNEEVGTMNSALYSPGGLHA